MNQFHDNLTSTEQGEVPNDHSADSVVEALAKLGSSAVTVAETPQERITLIAVQTTSGSQMHAQSMIAQWLSEMPEGIEAWWVAMDERYDNNDCDSAVFVHQGMQASVQELLVKAGASAAHNLPLTGG